MSELYANKVCLSPMVRSGTLPLRLLSLRYGADLVYGEEIVDKRIISSVRVPNAVLDTVDFISRSGESVVFRTCAEEAGKVVFQIGTADAVLALKAAEKVAGDVAAIDINMGCPKHFSVQGGMGAALLRKPEVACDIIKTLRRNLNIPVSCKIRLLGDAQATIDAAKRLQDAGACAIGVHMRQIHERPSHKASWAALAPVVAALDVPVLANGDVYDREDLAKLRELTGASSFLIARGALANASIFRKEGFLPAQQVAIDYLKVAAEMDNTYQNSKYNVMRMLPTTLEGLSEAETKGVVTVPELAATRSAREMYALWDLQNSYEQHQDRFRAKAAALQTEKSTEQSLPSLQASKVETTSSETVQARNNRVGKPEFFCQTCKVQLLSEQDVKLHMKGKKHKNVLRRQASATISKVVAKAVVQKHPVATDTTRSKSEEETTKERAHDGEDERPVKRIKHYDGALDSPADSRDARKEESAGVVVDQPVA